MDDLFSMKKLTLILICSLILTGCMGIPVVKGSDDRGRFEWMYGNFCGKGHPAVPSYLNNKKYQIDFLKNIKPVDDIDFACKLHDICYTISDDDSIEYCDEILSINVDKLTGSIPGTGGNKVNACNILLDEIGQFAEASFATNKKINNPFDIIYKGVMWTASGAMAVLNVPGTIMLGGFIHQGGGLSNSGEGCFSRGEMLIAPQNYNELMKYNSCIIAINSKGGNSTKKDCSLFTLESISGNTRANNYYPRRVR